MSCFEQSKFKKKKRDLSSVEQALFNGVKDDVITKAEYIMYLATLEKIYGRMLVRSDIGKKRK